MESAVERKRRLARERQRNCRARLSAEKAAAIKKKDRIREAHRRKNETAFETAARRKYQREKILQRIANETEEGAIQRRQRNANAMRAARVNNAGFIPDNYTYSENGVHIHNCGNMDSVCQFCSGKHFSAEKPSDGRFNNCCHKGKILHPIRREFPPYLVSLLSDQNHPHYRNFQENIRSYNSSLSFTSMGAQLQNPPEKGPFCFRVHGQIYHRASHIYPNEGKRRQYAQLYVVDSTQATEIRAQDHVNSGCLQEVLENLINIILKDNVYAQCFQTLHEIEVQEEQRAQEENIEMPSVNLVFNRDHINDRRRYNLPTVNEIAIVFRNEEGEPPFHRDFKVYPRNSDVPTLNLDILSPELDPMTYVLFFPHGEPGWQPHMAGNREDQQRQNISMLQHKISLTAVRDNEFNPLLNGGKLFQQWVVDSYLQVEAYNLNFIRTQQNHLKVEQHQGFADHLTNAANTEDARIGWTGSARNMREQYQDALAIVRKFGPPDIFLTMTCNPNWPEIQNNLFPGQTVSSRPDLVARVFSIKLQELVIDVTKRYVIGRVVAHCYTIEFPKSGLPHARLLLIFHPEEKPNSTERIDKIVCAEIPDPETESILYEIVKKFMIHGPCGEQNPNVPCMENNNCSKGFPKQFQQETFTNQDSYPSYRRRPGSTLNVGQKVVDNRYVEPYNKYLSHKYNCHLNVDICTFIRSVKYVYKDLYKGYDSVTVGISEHNEIKNFLDAKYVSAPEGMWRLLEFKMHDKSHTVIHLPVHLPQEQPVYFEEGQERQALERAAQHNTPLTAWFLLNQNDENARQYLYADIPYHYVYNKKMMQWTPRQRGADKIISEMYSVNPKYQERFYMRLLLLHVKGSRSFEELKTVDDVICGSYKEAAERRQLVQNDDEWRRCLEEASLTNMPQELRQLFAHICIFNNPVNPDVLFNSFEESLIEDFLTNHSRTISVQLALREIETTLSLHGLTCQELHLPIDDMSLTDSQNVKQIQDNLEVEA
ncbi:uncharacterized protein LOC115224483 [Octopus sinensis]|uniref:Uncharacterized protein LOC115224483 n=1 Tax=Octopus sinensis TaxID=2607531 RepID=A0A6P7TP66_9MOLL|nr:uncharacterized protein LOC115224483 [Octopus sinensis]